MAIDRQGAKIMFACDCCPEVFESEDRQEFNEAWAAAKLEGWRAKKIGTEWVHECPNCH